MQDPEIVDACVDCGAEVVIEQRSYVVGAESVLCMACAQRRGGAYDEDEDRWTVDPDVSDLLARFEAAPP